jgi:SnoaL-like domain
MDHRFDYLNVADGNPDAQRERPRAVPRPARMVSDADHASLSRLVEELAWRIDHGQADTVWQLFLPDGVLSTGGTPLVGHDAIRSWGRARVSSGVQTRHVCSGMRFTDQGNGQVTGSTLLTVFMREGSCCGSAIPAVVGEDTDEFVRTDAGWRLASRTFETLFVK